MAVAAAAASCPPIMHPSIVRSPGFATVTVGVAPEQANGLALCRGDTNASTCAACVAAAFREAKQTCPFDKGTNILRDACNLQFAGRQFLDFLRPDQWIVQELSWYRHGRGERQCLGCLVLHRRHWDLHRHDQQRGGGDQLDEEVLHHGGDGLQPQDLRAGAVRVGPDAGLVSGLPWVHPVGNHGAAHGRPAPEQRRCAGVVFAEVQRAVAGLRGSGDAAACRTAGTTISGHAFTCYSRIWSREERDYSWSLAPKKIGNPQCTVFDLISLQEATEHFSEKNKLGEGGFGTVYKGILSDGEDIAVKTLLGRTRHALHQLHNEIQVLRQTIAVVEFWHKTVAASNRLNILLTCLMDDTQKDL
ncbi:hypothetical protein SEVIR_7G013805v4 [Setaria viridis]